MIQHSLVKKILVIKLRAIGDVLLSTVVLKNLHRYFPGAQLDVLTEPPGKEVVEGNSVVHEILVYDPRHGNGARLIADVRRRHYDLVIDLFGNPRSALVTLLSRATYRVGYRFGWRVYCYNIIVEPRGGDVHNTGFNLDALRHIVIPVREELPEFPLGAADQAFAGDFFMRERLSGKRVVALNPGGGWPAKRWPEASYAKLGARIAAEDGASIIILWGPGEEDRAKRIAASISAPSVLIPPTTLKQLGAILKKCDMLVTNDSGSMHIAAALGTPVVAIFGPTNPELQGPVGAPHVVVQHQRLLCLGCNFTSCPIDNPCMEELRPDDVYAAYKKLSLTVHKSEPGKFNEKTQRIPQEEK